MKFGRPPAVQHVKTMVFLMIISFTSSVSQKVFLHKHGRAALAESEVLEELEVSPDSHYCSTLVDKLDCNFNATDKVVVVPEEMTLQDSVPVLQIQQAKTVDIYPNCVPGITVIEVGLLTTLPHKSFKTRHCGYWLQIRRSAADLISYGVKHLSISHSNVYTLNLKNLENFSAENSSIAIVESLKWKGEISYVTNTSIVKVKNMVCLSNWTVSNSHIIDVSEDGIIFEGSSLTVINTVFDQIALQGIRILTGVATFTNVVIDRVDSSGIVIRDPEAHLVLTNVTVNSAQKGFIKLLDRLRISLQNVTVNGTSIDLLSEFIWLEEEIFPLDEVSEIDEKSQSCIFDYTRITCDFSLFNETLVFHADESDRYAEIKNADSLEVRTVFCNLELRLVNVTAIIPRPLSDQNIDWNTCNLTMTISHSTIKEFSVQFISMLTVINSTLETFHDTVVNDLFLEETTVHKAYNLNITGSESNWSGFQIFSTYNTTLNGPVIANDIPVLGILKKDSLTVSHSNSTSEISNLRVNTLSSDAIRVIEGTLVMRDFECMVMFEGAIYLEEGTALHIHFKKDPFICYASISAASRKQVTLEGLSARAEATIVHVRRRVPPPIDDGSNFTITDLHRSPYCSPKRSFFLAVVECDYLDVPNATVDVNVRNGVGYTAQVSSAAFATLYPSCVSKMILKNITKATTINSDDTCETWLEAVEVNFINLTSGVHDISLTNCSVELLSLDHVLRDVDLENTHVEKMIGLHWTEYEGVINSSYIGAVEDVTVSSHVVMHNTTIDQIHPRGITVLGYGIITNCTINRIAHEGITVVGKLRIENTTVNNISSKGIVVQDGMLFLFNVNFEFSEELSLVATGNGAITMKNVTVGGQKIYWRGYIADSLVKPEFSVAFLNKIINENQNPFVIPQENRTDSSKSEISHIIQTDLVTITVSKTVTVNVKDSNFSSGEGLAPPEPVASMPTSWKNATIIMSVFAVILIICCVLLVIKLVKYKNFSVSSIVFWRKKDDNITLITEMQSYNDATEIASYDG